ncbi:MAG: glycosyltransferase family 1 protein [Treponema sp.]|nr:glycosyltransferase family 1 protein [Treponema sp.]
MNKATRILHVLGNLDRGGAETFIMNIYRHIERSRIQFDFMVHTMDKWAYDDEILSLGGQIYRVPPYRIVNHVQYESEWSKFLKNNNSYKMIHGHMTSTASVYLKLAKRKGITTASHSHNTSSGQGVSAIIKDMLQVPLKSMADYLFACSMAAGKWCYGKDFHERTNFHMIQNAIDTEKFIYNPFVRNLKREELGIESKFIIGHIGRFNAQKNHSFLIDIFKNIYDQNRNAILLLVGDGVLRKNIEKKVEKLGLKDNVIFTGVRSDIPELLCAMDVFLLPSLYEGLPVTLVEAQANGLRCIISDVITQEAKVTNLLEYLPLQESASYWARKILEFEKGYERENMQKVMANAGFDIKNVAKWLEDFYCEVS